MSSLHLLHRNLKLKTTNIRLLSNLVAIPKLKAKYDNFINGKFVPPVKGEYFDNISPIDGKFITKAARSTKVIKNI